MKFLSITFKKTFFVCIQIFSLTCAFLFLASNLTSPVYSQVSKIGFAVSPPIIEKTVKPGSKITGTIRLENFNQEGIQIEAKVTNFKSKGDKGQIDITEDEVPYSARTWIKITKTSPNIKKGGFGFFDYTIEVPNDVSPGGYTGAILFIFKGISGNVEVSDGSSAKILQQIASIFILQVPGEAEEKILIRELSPLTPLFLYNRVKLISMIDNIGNTHQKPYGNIVIKDLFGNTVRTIDVPGRNVLRETRRIYEEEFDFDNFGIFRAELNIYYGDIEKKQTSAVAYFGNIDIEKAIKILIGIIFIFLLIKVGRKYININISLSGKSEGKQKKK